MIQRPHRHVCAPGVHHVLMALRYNRQAIAAHMDLPIAQIVESTGSYHSYASARLEARKLRADWYRPC